jgi:Tfp pilus assembly PilM family ATPase
LELARSVPVGGNDFTECVAEHCGVGWAEAEKIKTTPGSRLVEGGMLITAQEREETRVPCESVVGRLAREMLRSLRFFTSQFAEGSYLGMIGSTSISGGGALLKGLDACLQVQGIDVTGIVNPFTGLSVDVEGIGLQSVSECAAQYTTAVGLAVGDYWSGETAESTVVAAA